MSARWQAQLGAILLHSKAYAPGDKLTKANEQVDLQELCTEPDVVESAVRPGDRQLGGKLAGLSITKQMLVLAIWPFLENLLGFMVSMVDLLIAGRFADSGLSRSATAAIGVSGYLNWMMFLVQGAVAVGTVALVSRATGAKHKRLANAAVGQSILIAIIGAVAVGLSVCYWASPLIKLCFSSLSEQAHQYAVQYLQIMSAALPLSGIMVAGNASLRASGDTRSPFFAMMTVNIVNVVMSNLFVFGPDPIGGRQVAGLAMGSVAGWLVGMLVVATILIRGRSTVTLKLHRLSPHWHTIKRLLRISIPGGIESFGLWFIHFLMFIFIGKIATGVVGEAIIGAHIMGIRLESISYMPGFAMSTAAATLAGMYLGLGDAERARKAVNACWLGGVFIMGTCGLFFFFIPEQITYLLNENNIYQHYVPAILRLSAFAQIFFATKMVLMGAIRGAGDTKYTLFVTWFSSIVVRLGGILIVFNFCEPTLYKIWIVMNIDIVTQALMIYYRYRGKGWTEVQV